MRYIGFIIVLAASYAIGIVAGSSYKSRLRELTIFHSIVTDMIQTLSFAPLSLEDLFGQYTAQKYGPFADIFKRLATEATASPEPCESIFQRILDSAPLSCSPQQRQLMAEAIAAFSLPEKGRVSASLSLAAGRLELAIQSAQDDIRQKGDLMQKLSVACGVFAIIILW